MLEVLYLIFNEGYSATAGDDWVRPALCEEAMRLGRVLAELAPDEPEVHGLVALMELQASRLRARVGAGGEPVRLADQNRARWDRLLIGRGLTGLRRAQALGNLSGPYALRPPSRPATHARPASRPPTGRRSPHYARDWSTLPLADRAAESRGRGGHGGWAAGRRRWSMPWPPTAR